MTASEPRALSLVTTGTILLSQILLRKDDSLRIYRRFNPCPLSRSPRARRRLVWSRSAAVLVVIGLAIALLIPSTAGGDPGANGPAGAGAARRRHAPSARRRRPAGDRRLLDRFFPAAVARRDADTAWALAGPEMRRRLEPLRVPTRDDAGSAVPRERAELPPLAGDRRREGLGGSQHPRAPEEPEDPRQLGLLDRGREAPRPLAREQDLPDRDDEPADPAGHCDPRARPRRLRDSPTDAGLAERP